MRNKRLTPNHFLVLPNIWFIVLSLAVIALSEYVFRYQHNSLVTELSIKNIRDIVILLTIISFVRSRIILSLFAVFVVMMTLFQNIHYDYYGTWIFPFEIYLFFDKFGEVSDTFLSLRGVVTIPLFLMVFMSVSFLYINRYTVDRIQGKKGDYLFALLLLLLLAKPMSGDSLGSRPNDNKSVIKNSLYTTAYFITTTLPDTILGNTRVDSYEHPPYSLLDSAGGMTSNTVVLIIGESLAAENMSLFGYERDTTPNLINLAKDERFYAKQAISAGVFTDTSIPLLINVSSRPDSTEQILSGKTNLFKMAKENGYTTHFISMHTNEGLSYIRSYLSVHDVDYYSNASEGATLTDGELISKVSKIDFTAKNFIVLSMVGSHSPYKARVPDNFSPFGDSRVIDQYDNSVSYTDLVVPEIMSTIYRASSKSSFVFTSDHGESVKVSAMGHGDIRNPSHYTVPFFLYMPMQGIPENINEVLEQNSYVSHFTISRITGYLLGYDTLREDVGSIYYVNGRELNGNSGYMELHFSDNQVGEIIFYD